MGVSPERLRGVATYPVTLEGLDASSTLGSLLGNAARCGELPHLDSLVQATADEIAAVGRECHAVDAVLVAIGAFEALNNVAELHVPDADALVEGASSDVLGIGRDGNRSNTVFDAKDKGAARRLDIPQSHGSVSASGGDGSSVARKVQRVDILLVAGKSVANGSRGDIPNLYDRRG